VVEVLLQRFLERSAADLILLCAYPDHVSREAVGFVAHRLAGAAGVFGYAEVGDAAAALEAALEQGVPDESMPVLPLAQALTAMLAD
jgi:HPt (histidine-containing phosphotransfer) domain-containing protein